MALIVKRTERERQSVKTVSENYDSLSDINDWTVLILVVNSDRIIVIYYYNCMLLTVERFVEIFVL